MSATQTPVTKTAKRQRLVLVAFALLSAVLVGVVMTGQARSGSGRGSGDVTIRPGQTAVFHVHGQYVGCGYWKGEVQCSYPDGTPVMTTSTGQGRIRGMVIYLSAGGTVNVKSVHVPARNTFAGRDPEDDTVWTFR